MVHKGKISSLKVSPLLRLQLPLEFTLTTFQLTWCAPCLCTVLMSYFTWLRQLEVCVRACTCACEHVLGGHVFKYLETAPENLSQTLNLVHRATFSVVCVCLHVFASGSFLSASPSVISKLHPASWDKTHGCRYTGDCRDLRDNREDLSVHRCD